MILELRKVIKGLTCEVFFFLGDGPLKDKLIEKYMQRKDAYEDILELELDASVRIRHAEGAKTTAIECLLEAGDFQYRALLGVGDLDEDECAELMEYLRARLPVSATTEARPGKNILRKKKGPGLLGIAEASKALGLSQRSLKSLIPCSEIRIVEEGDEKAIKDYYWERELVERFVALKDKQRPGSEDLAFIARCCCEGDLRWARELVAGFLKQRLG